MTTVADETAILTASRRKLACLNCRQRRRKCNMENPCRNCAKLGLECIFTDQDLRRNRHTVSYVKALEHRIAQLESYLVQIKQTDDNIERNRILNSINTNDIIRFDLSDGTLNSIDNTTQQEPDIKFVSTNNRTVSNNKIVFKNADSTGTTTPATLSSSTTTSEIITHTETNIINNRKRSTSSDSDIENKIANAYQSENNTSSEASKSGRSSPILAMKSPSSRFVQTNSIYPKNSLSMKNKKSKTSKTPAELDLATIRGLSRSPLILRALSIFFKWLYPGHYMFIHRETFLSAFFDDPATKSYYCSEELVYAIAALGALASKNDDELYTKSIEYYQRAKKIVLTKTFQLVDRSLAESTSSSKLAIIQTLLCLAFYDIAKAENPMAWYLSGLAFRIAHEIGLHLNPEAWNHVYEDELSPMDTAVRSRIYWGCYIADHLISVLFGRSTLLRMSNSTVPETDELPDIETGIEDYIFLPGIPLSLANPLKKLVILSRISEIFATKIFIQHKSIDQRSEYLNKFNQEMDNWRNNLPNDIKWGPKTLKTLKKYDPTMMYMWFHFYIVLISYNKPFIFEIDRSKEIIENYIEELCWLLKTIQETNVSWNNFDLYMIYSTILCVQCMNTDVIQKKRYSFFIGILNKASHNYELAKIFLEIVRNQESNNKVDAGTDFTNLLGSLSHGNDFALEYNFDFTLLNEIDELINSK